MCHPKFSTTESKPTHSGGVVTSVSPRPLWHPVATFIVDFEFNESLEHHTYDENVLTATETRTIVLFLPWHKDTMERLIGPQLHQGNGLNTSKMDKFGNVYTVFGMWLQHTHIKHKKGNKKPASQTLAIKVCTARTSPAGVVQLPDAFSKRIC